MRRWDVAAGVAALGVLAMAPVRAEEPPATALFRYAGADLALGAQLLKEHGCTACHVGKVGGDGSAIYRPKGRINTPAALESMVQLCSTELNLALFPEDVTAVAGVLQRDHYKFPAGSR
jgi:hypothetical protein